MTRLRRFPVVLAGLTTFTAIAGWLGGYVLTADSVSICIFRSLTGRPCIFCGMTHALVYAMRGNWSMASHENPAWWLILPMFLVLTAGVISGRWRLGWPLIAIAVAGTVARAWL